LFSSVFLSCHVATLRVPMSLYTFDKSAESMMLLAVTFCSALVRHLSGLSCSFFVQLFLPGYLLYIFICYTIYSPRGGLDAVTKSPCIYRELNSSRPSRGLVTILMKLSCASSIMSNGYRKFFPQEESSRSVKLPLTSI